MTAVKAWDAASNGARWYPDIRSITPKYLGLRLPSRWNNGVINVIGQPSRSSVQAFRRTKSSVNRHSPGVGFGTMCTWLHSLAVECRITPNCSNLSHCSLICVCFSTECDRGGSLCLGDFHFASSMFIVMAGMSADSLRTDVAKTSQNSAHSALNLRCKLSGPSI